jgi:hypothetical protein
MRGKFLGDSYDLVKRFWFESLRTLAPLYAHPRFVPSTIQTQYTNVTSIRIFDVGNPPDGPFGLLLDPHTGIPLPGESVAKVSLSHAPLPFIVEVNRTLGPAYLICFDQSLHRGHSLTSKQQLEKKRDYLQSQGIGSFYFDSHAPFLFMAQQSEWLSAIKSQLISCGIPEERFELRSGGQETPC